MHPLATTKPLPRQTQKHKASDAALPAARQFYERRNPASGTSASSAKMQKGRQVFELLPESTIAKKACSICLISHRVAGRMTRESHLTRSSHPAQGKSRPSQSSQPLPSLLEDARKTVGLAMSVHLRALPISAVTWLIHIISPASFSLVLWQTLKRPRSWEWPSLSAPLSHAAATAHCAQSTRCRQFSAARLLPSNSVYFVHCMLSIH